MDPNRSGQTERLAMLCKEAGGVTFARFMRDALWGPGGYYTRQVRIGTRESDFFTAAASPLFGGSLAHYVLNAWHKQSDRKYLHLVELGPGEGHLMVHMLADLLRMLPESVVVAAVFVEPSQTLEERQKKVFSEFVRALPEVRQRRISAAWKPDIGYVSDNVVLVANEVLDALPVERVRKSLQGFEQGYVVYKDGHGFSLEWRSCSSQLQDLAHKWLPIPTDTVAELCTDLPDFFRAISMLGNEVRAIFIDYGIHMAEWEDGVRPHGTVRSFRNHRLVDVLAAAGHADITADVHWEYAVDAATVAGFHVLPVLSQSAFLMKWNILDVLQRLQSGGTMGVDTDLPVPPFQGNMSASSRRWTGQFKQLLLPGGMGERFSVLECMKE